MAPLRQLKNVSNETISNKMATRSNSTQTSIQPRAKRKANASPQKENGNGTKRPALGDLTNNKQQKTADENNKKQKPILKQSIKKTVTVQQQQQQTSKVVSSIKTVVKSKQNENIPPPNAPKLSSGIVTRAAVKQVVTNQTAVKAKVVVKDNGNANKIKTRLSNEFDKTEESLYVTASEEQLHDSILSSVKSNNKSDQTSVSSSELSNTPESKKLTNVNTPGTSVSLVTEQLENKLNLGNHEVPDGVDDFDKENWNDPLQVSHYAMDIFNYLKNRELQFTIPDYMERQVCLTTWMRSVLVDWMVDVQESFELNHETLYLAVKLVDIYLSRMTVSRDTLQLVGAASIFIASKYDERIAPSMKDFLYICDNAYSERELLRMEINILKIVDFDLGIPISYRFLRRYARCARISMPILTLARYILEYSLMDYATVAVRDSKLAAASLYLACQMKDICGWTPALEFYSGYKLSEIQSVVYLLNDGLHRKHKTPLKTVRNKYSHKIFFEVAKIPLLTNEELNL